MKKILSFCLVIVLCFIFISCGIDEPTIEGIQYEIGDISFSVPNDFEIDMIDENAILFSNDMEALAMEVSILDKGQFDKKFEEISNSISFNDVEKCEFAGMPTISYFTQSGQPGYILVDLDNSMGYFFTFGSYTIEDEDLYVSIMQTITKKKMNQ